jgi:uncharacterized membrane protein (GlpM family)
MLQMTLRFLIGGAIVSLFALLGDLIRPKGFAGLFAAAPAVALATLALAAFSQGGGYASLEARSMIGGAMAFFAYAIGCVYFLGVRHAKSLPTTVLMLALWGLAAGSFYVGILRK